MQVTAIYSDTPYVFAHQPAYVNLCSYQSLYSAPEFSTYRNQAGRGSLLVAFIPGGDGGEALEGRLHC